MKTISTHAHVAKLIRAELKARKITGRVISKAYSGGDSVDVQTTDLDPVTVKELTAFCDQFEYGHFDGMTDCYEYSNSRDDIPQVKFVHVSNRCSETMCEAIKAHLRGKYSNAEDLIERDYGRKLYQIFNGSDTFCGFWTARA